MEALSSDEMENFKKFLSTYINDISALGPTRPISGQVTYPEVSKNIFWFFWFQPSGCRPTIGDSLVVSGGGSYGVDNLHSYS